MVNADDCGMKNSGDDAEVKRKLAELSLRGQRLAKDIEKLQAALKAGGWEDKAPIKNGDGQSIHKPK